MKSTRRILAALLAALAAVLLAAGSAWLLVDDATLVAWLVKRVESASETRISYQQGASVTRTLTPVLSLEGLVVEDTEGKYRFETRSLLIQASLPWLLAGRVDIPRLLVGDTRININRTDAEKKPGSQAPIDFSALRLRPVLHDVRVSEIALLIEGRKLQLPSSELSELSLRLEAGKDIPQLTAQLNVEGEVLSIDVKLPELRKAIKHKQLPFSIAVKGLIADSSAVGRIDLSRPDATVTATLRTLLPDLEKLPAIAGSIKVPGELIASGKLAGTFSQLALEEMSITWNGPGQSTATLQGRVAHVSDFSGLDLELAARLDRADWLQALLPETMAPLVTAELAAGVSGNAGKLDLRGFSVKARTDDELDIALTGQLDIAQLFTAPAPENLKLDLSFSAPTTRAARALVFEEIPELGAITATGEIHSTRGPPRLENIVIRTKDKQGITAGLEGSIAQFPLAADKPNTGYALDTVIRATQTAVLAERVGLDLPLAGPLDLTFRIEGDTEALQLNRLKLSAGRDDKTLFAAQGHLEFRDWAQADPLDKIDLALEMRGRDTGFLEAWGKQELPAMAYNASARLHTVAGKHRLDDFVENTPPGEPLQTSLTGRAEQVTLFPEFSLTGIHVDLKASTDDISTLNTLFSLNNSIPAIGPLELAFSYSGTNTKLLLDNFSLTAGHEDIMLATAKGRLGYISAAKKWHLEDTDLAFRADSASSKAFAAALGFRIPELGTVSATASLNDRNRTLGLTSLKVLVGDSSAPALSAEGYIGNIYTASKVQLDVRLDLDGQRFAAFADRQDLPELSPVTGRMMISDSKGPLGIHSLHVESTTPERLTLKIDGRYDDFSKPETLLLNSHLKVRDLQLLGALFDQDWTPAGPVEFNARVKKVDRGTALSADLALGKATVDMKLRGNFDRSPPYINGTVTAQNVFFKDPLDKAAEGKKAQKKNRDKKKKDRKKENSPVFSRAPIPFQWLKKADLDLTVDIDSFDQDQWDAQSAKFVIALKSGHLAVRPAAFVYTEGTMDLELEVDTRDTPAMVLKATAKDVNPWRGEQSGGPGDEKYENASYDIDLSLGTSGNSAHELASNAEGDIYLTVQDGWLRRSLVDMLFVDLAGWSINLVKGSKYAPVNCGVADYSIRQGVISTNAFFIDAKNITVTGEGTIDLGKEQVDYVFIPRKKSRIILKAEPVKVKGPLNNPSVKAIPVKSAALTFGTLIFAPYVFAGMVATDYASGAIRDDDDGKSACVEYEEKRRKARTDKASP